MILFLYGEESFLLRKRLRELVEGFQAKYDQYGVSITRLDGSTLKTPDLHGAIASVGLFTQKRLVVVDGFCESKKNSSEQNQLLEYLQRSALSDDQILIFVDAISRSTSKLFEFLKKGKHAERFDPLGPGKLRDWSRAQFQEFGMMIEPDALTQLLSRTGTDLWRLSNEIHKLATFRKKGTVTVEIVRELISTSLDDQLFQFTDAVIEKRVVKALKLLEQQFRFGNSPQQLLSGLSWQLRTLKDVKTAMEQPIDVASDLRLHPFVVRKLSVISKLVSYQELDRMIEVLIASDFQLKTQKTDPKTILDRCVLELCRRGESRVRSS